MQSLPVADSESRRKLSKTMSPLSVGVVRNQSSERESPPRHEPHKQPKEAEAKLIASNGAPSPSIAPLKSPPDRQNPEVWSPKSVGAMVDPAPHSQALPWA